MENKSEKRPEGAAETAATQSTADLTLFIQNLLQQMHTRFETMADAIVSKIDAMSQRIDELEQNVSQLVLEVDAQQNQSQAQKQVQTPPGQP